MIDKIIGLLTKLSAKLQEFAGQYNNPQCRKTALICGSVGLVLGYTIAH